MATVSVPVVARRKPRARIEELLLQETEHRAVNDLQLVVSLLSLQARRAHSVEAREALGEATERVAVLARARAAQRHGIPRLPAALRQLCDALYAQAEPRGVFVTLKLGCEADWLSAERVTVLALVANELATNAIKYAFADGRAGRIEITTADGEVGGLLLVIDDDGLPFPDPEHGRDGGMGLVLVRRLLQSIDATMAMPSGGSKRFEIRLAA